VCSSDLTGAGRVLRAGRDAREGGGRAAAAHPPRMEPAAAAAREARLAAGTGPDPVPAPARPDPRLSPAHGACLLSPVAGPGAPRQERLRVRGSRVHLRPSGGAARLPAGLAASAAGRPSREIVGGAGGDLAGGGLRPHRLLSRAL